MTLWARIGLLVAIGAGAMLVLGIFVLTDQLGQDSPLRRGLFALLLIPFGVAGVAARPKKNIDKTTCVDAQQSLRSGVVRWLVIVGLLSAGVIAIGIVGSLIAH